MDNIDITDMRNILGEFLQELDGYLDEDPENYRRLMRYSHFSFGMGPDYNDRIILCVSYRNKKTFTRGLSEPEWNKTQKIIDALRSQGYTCSRRYAAAPGGTEKYFCRDMVESDSGELFPYYYISGGEEELTVNEVMPAFMPPDEVIRYLDDPGDIRRHCRYYASREKKYCMTHKMSADPIRVCRSECPISCITEPQIKVSTQYRNMCFQVLEFTRYHCITGKKNS